jgi:hypothetical protein
MGRRNPAREITAQRLPMFNQANSLYYMNYENLKRRFTFAHDPGKRSRSISLKGISMPLVLH